jgi:xylulokinase
LAPPGNDLTVGIDIGTTSVKGVLVDGHGTVLARKRIPHPMISVSPAHMEHDPQLAWRRSPRRVMASVAMPGVRAIGVTGMGPSLTAVNRRGIPVGPGLLYGDQRGDAKGGVGEAVGFLRTLAALHPEAAGFWPAQATAIASLNGSPVIGGTVASMMAPLWTGTAWDAELVGSCGARAEQLPMVRSETEPAGHFNDAVISSGLLDVVCERMMAGTVEDDEALVLCGSTLIMMMPMAHYTEVPGVWTYPTGSTAMATGASNAGAFFLDWVDRVIAKGDDTIAHPDRVPVWVPYIRGERTPWHDPSRRASLVGLDITHDAASLRRAAYEASGFVVRHHLQLADSKPRRVIAVGGGTAIPGWTQALADCVGVPVEVRGTGVGAAVGAAFMARIAAGLESSPADIERWVRPTQSVLPRKEWAESVSSRYELFLRIVTE